MPFFPISLSLPSVQPKEDSTSTKKATLNGEVETLQAVLRQRKTYYSKV